MTKPISPVIVMFKELPRVRVRQVRDIITTKEPSSSCKHCRLGPNGSNPCYYGSEFPNGGCYTNNFIWREVPPKEGK